MNIVFSHGFKIKNCGDSDSTQGESDLENYLFNEFPEGFTSEEECGLSNGECLRCKDFKHSEFLEKETSKLYKTCNKYKNKLEIIRENINNIIKENEDEDDFYQKAADSRLEGLDTRIMLDDLTALAMTNLSTEYPHSGIEEEEEEEEDIPPLGIFK